VPATRDLADRIERLCGKELSAKALRERLIVEVRRAVRFDGTCSQ
jgi:hypothetical protein